MATTSSSKQSAPRSTPGNGAGNSKGPGNGKGRPAPRRKRNPFWARVKTFFTLVSFCVMIVIVTLMVWVGIRLYQAPRTIDLANNPLGITYIYSSDGTPLAEFFTERRKVITIDDMPQNLQNATIAFEDRRFYQNSGIDVKGIGRAVFSNFVHGDAKGEGGSTITQQLARNMGVEGLTRQKSYGRKFNELIIASQINNSYTKQQILEMYLNQVNYGSGAYGVEAAAEVYFNKHAKQLDLAQCALLAGLPNRPADFSPYKSLTAAKGQRQRVLDQMLDQKYITQIQYQQASAETIKLAQAKAPSQGSQIFHAPYFVNYVVDQLRHKYGSDRLYEGNLKVYTTLNWPMQQIAEQEVQQGIANSRGLGPTQGALVCLDPQTGEIKAMVGGVDYKKSQINYAVHGRQPGSSFKAIVYAAAINDGTVKEDTPVMDARTTFGTGHGSYTPQDDTGYSDRYMNLREAVAYSVNVVAVKVLHTIGPQGAIRYARMMGVHAPLDPVLSLALGSSPVSPLEMASAYSTFPAGGNHPEPAAWTRLDDAQDNVIEDVPPAIETHILQKDTVSQLDDMLRAVVTDPRGTGAMVAPLVPDARGKTGTTQDHKDVWFVGYTTQLVCAVWAGHPIDATKHHPAAYGQEMEHLAFGGTVCAPIWAKFMSRSLPIFHAARVKELALEKSKQAPVAKPITAADTATAISTDPSADGSADSSDDTPRSRHHRQHGNQAHDNGDGTVTVNVDDSSGLLAPEGSPGSHSETFSSGTQPTTLSPQYSTDSGSDTQQPFDNSPETTTDNSQGGSEAAPDTSASTDSTPTPTRRHHRDTISDTVTVTINPEDGLLATKWCPQQISRTYPRGQEPHTHSRMYPPPPGEQ
ncbi:MAG: transglycosylase domain-containing protein [Janthinobacterium lividum]